MEVKHIDTQHGFHFIQTYFVEQNCFLMPWAFAVQLQGELWSVTETMHINHSSRSVSANKYAKLL